MGLFKNRLREGMIVRSLDGEKLGKIVRCGEEEFIIEKGFFFPKDYAASYANVDDIREGEVYLAGRREDLQPFTAERQEETRTERATDQAWATGENLREDASTASNVREETRIPLVEEELVAEKHIEERGRVLVRKEVITEQKQITVPVSREEVRVERVPATESKEAAPGEASFSEEEIVVPVREEVVEVHKKPVVREEVRISKEARRESRTVRDTTRRETAKIEKEPGTAEEEEEAREYPDEPHPAH